VKSWIAPWLVLLVGCRIDIPDGVIACSEAGDCPSGFQCRHGGSDATKTYCFRGAADRDGGARRGARDAADDGGARADGARPRTPDAGPVDAASHPPNTPPDTDSGAEEPDGGFGEPMPIGGDERGSLGPSGLLTLGTRRSGGAFTIYDDGLEGSERRCTADGQYCISGGLQP